MKSWCNVGSVKKMTCQQMVSILWIFSILCPFLAHSESGDSDDTVVCSSTLTFKETILSCYLDAEDFEFASLCSDTCVNGTLGYNSVSFQNLSILQPYKLQTHFKEGEVHTQDISLVKIVKIPTPKISNITYTFEEAVIYIKYKHDYVTEPCFEVQIRESSVKVLSTLYQPLTISRSLLRDHEEYYVSVRAQPINYFSGEWTNWSQEKSFIVHTDQDQNPLILYGLLFTSVILLIFIGGVVLKRKEIKTRISPNIPHPKATLAQIHRLKEHPPVSFSPEMFNDVNIYRVDYNEETHLAPELCEGCAAVTGCCPVGTGGMTCSQPSDAQDRDHQSIETEVTHLKMKLLDQSVSAEEGENHVGCQSLAALQRDYKDESYVTMSSLYKT